MNFSKSCSRASDTSCRKQKPSNGWTYVHTSTVVEENFEGREALRSRNKYIKKSFSCRKTWTYTHVLTHHVRTMFSSTFFNRLSSFNLRCSTSSGTQASICSWSSAHQAHSVPAPWVCEWLDTNVFVIGTSRESDKCQTERDFLRPCKLIRGSEVHVFRRRPSLLQHCLSDSIVGRMRVIPVIE
jgi:hypothetical protein